MDSAVAPNGTEVRILDGARRCFENIGVRKTRMEDVAAEAGVSRQTIYKYFASKRDIIDRIGHLEMAAVNVRLREQLRRSAPFAERLTEALVLSVEISLANPYIRKTVEDLDLLPGFPSPGNDIYAWQRQQWRHMIERASLAGDLAADLDLDRIVQWLILSQLLLMIAYERLSADGVDVPAFVRRFMVEPMLRGHGASRPPAPVDDAALRDENAMLRALVSEQALEIFRLRGG